MAPLHVNTPYLRSYPIEDKLKSTADAHREVYLKLDCLQASGSFKDRGVLRLCQWYHAKGIRQLVSSSGGNAGLAVAHAGRLLGMKVHVVVPKTTKANVVAKLETVGAEVEVHGENWNQADEKARGIVAGDSANIGYCNPFDHPEMWEGHASVVDEIAASGQPKPDAIILSVGGGGLLNGVLLGLKRQGWSDVAVVAIGAVGANSFHESFTAGSLQTLPAITSICTSMGARTVSDQCLPLARAHGNVTSIVVTDAQAVQGMLETAVDHRLLVEPTCGAAMAPLYVPELRRQLKPEWKRVAVVCDLFNHGGGGRAVMLSRIVCGGNAVSPDLLREYREKFSAKM